MDTEEFVSSQLDVLRNEGHWSRALFLTYTLSLTFFETYILPVLRRSGCDDIWIIVDEEGYRSSLMERRSTRIGQEYRVVPVSLPNGIFHPKCTYLSSADEALLMVGSGNLTFGGYGRNAECLNVLSTDRHQNVFNEFADFIEALCTSETIEIPNTDWGKIFAASARQSAASSPVREDPNVRLLHTVYQSAHDQIVETASHLGEVESLTIMSPFFDPDGKGVRKLVDQLQPKRLQIALPPSPHEPTPFPFPASKNWRTNISACRATDIEDERTLHAKWFELEIGKNRVSVVGSVNATNKSLQTADNIEVAIVYIDEETKSYSTWERAPIPTHVEPNIFVPGTKDGAFLVYAELSAGNKLRGRVIPSTGEEVTWTGHVLLPTGAELKVDALINSSGEFSSQIEAKQDLTYGHALQIQLTSEFGTARGWIHLNEILQLPNLGRLGVSSLIRMINREEVEDDDIALLDYFAVSASKHISVFGAKLATPVPAPEENSENDKASSTIPIHLLAPGTHEFSPSEQTSIGGGHPGSAIERLFLQLRKRLLGISHHEKPLETDSSPHIKGSVDDDEDNGSHFAVRNRFESFNDEMMFLVKEPDANPEMKRGILAIWFEVSLHMLLRRIGSPSEAASFVRNWFNITNTVSGAGDEPGSLEQHFLSAAVLCAHFDHMAQKPERLGQYHEAIESFWRGETDNIDFGEIAEPDLRTELFTALFPEDAGSPTKVLKDILSAPTLRAELLSVLSAYEGEIELPDAPLMTRSAVGKSLYDQLAGTIKKKPTKPIYKRLNDDRLMCAHCYRVLTPSQNMNLVTHRIAQCDTNCHKFTVRVSI